MTGSPTCSAFIYTNAHSNRSLPQLALGVEHSFGERKLKEVGDGLSGAFANPAMRLA